MNLIIAYCEKYMFNTYGKINLFYSQYMHLALIYTTMEST